VRGHAGGAHRQHHDAPSKRFQRREHAAAELVFGVAHQFRIIEDRADRLPGAGKSDEKQGQRIGGSLAEGDIENAVRQIRHRNSALVALERKVLPDPVGQQTAGQQAQPRKAPDAANSAGAALKYDFAK